MKTLTRKISPKQRLSSLLRSTPGVHFPSSGTKENPLRYMPEDGILTAQVAELLNTTTSAALSLLHRHNLKFQYVALRHGSLPTLSRVWPRAQVEKLIRNLPPILPSIPQGYISALEVQEKYSIPRTRLARLIWKLGLTTMYARIPSGPMGLRTRLLIKKDDMFDLLHPSA